MFIYDIAIVVYVEIQPISAPFGPVKRHGKACQNKNNRERQEGSRNGDSCPTGLHMRFVHPRATNFFSTEMQLREVLKQLVKASWLSKKGSCSNPQIRVDSQLEKSLV